MRVIDAWSVHLAANELDKKRPNTHLSVELLANAISASSDALVIKDRTGKILIGSQGVAEFFQCEVNELPGLNAYDHLPKSIAARTRECDKRVFESGTAETGEELWDLGYDRRIFLASRSPIRDSSGEVVGVLTAYKNISAIKFAFEFFEQDRKRFEKLAETCPVGIFECNPYHQLAYVNPEWERIIGLSANDALGRHWGDFIVPEQRHLVGELIRNANESTSGERIDLQVTGDLGCTVELSLNRVADADNHTVSYIGSLVDLTFRLAAQKQLRQKASLMRDLTSSVPAVIWQMSVEGKCVFASDYWMELTGQPIHAIVGQNWNLFVHPNDLPSVERGVRSVIDQEQNSASFEYRLKGKEGDWRWVLTNCQQIHTMEGNFMGVAGHTIDITERRKAELELQQYSVLLEQRVGERTHELMQMNKSLRNEMETRIQAEELLEEKRTQLAHFSRISIMGRLSGELAHELNQPLNAIQNYVASLAKIIDSPTSPPAAAHVLRQLNNEISRAAKIIRRTREFVSTGKHQSDELRLSEMVEDTVAMLRGEARRRGMSLQVRDSHDKTSFMGDLVRLQQVLVNLVLNAMESMVTKPGSDKTVLIELRKEPNHHILSVYDSGCGISESEQARLFDAFFTTKPTGLGMGLAISRGIIEDHGGTLTFQPRTNGGSIFTIALPC